MIHAARPGKTLLPLCDHGSELRGPDRSRPKVTARQRRQRFLQTPSIDMPDKKKERSSVDMLGF
jgi:hypothetical protein